MNTPRHISAFESLERRLHLARPDPSPAENVLFRLPLSSDTSVHYYFDRNDTSAATAWNGTGQSYDGHRGTDFSGGPRGRPVYAAADGILIGKDDGWADFEGPGNGNYVRINHGNDRSGLPIHSVYLHFEAGTPTTKPIGSFIAAGEQIGGIGTSGHSTGLHLHFETQLNRVAFDPFRATGSSEVSWWVAQGAGAPSTTANPDKLQVGDTAVVYDTTSLNVRGPNPTSSPIGTRSAGATGTVLEGPVYAAFNNDWTNSLWVWYRIQWDDGLTGWSAHNWLQEAVDTTAPVVQSAQFRYDLSPQRMEVRFSEDVGASVGQVDFEITRLSDGFTFSSPVTYDAATRTATIQFGGILSDGNYRLRVKASGISDQAGNPMPADSVQDFFALAADVNHDRTVDVTDLAIIATNWQQSPRTFAQGDLTYNGVVDIADLSKLATAWQSSIRRPASIQLARPFNTTRLARLVLGDA